MVMSMDILALDLSTKTGWAFFKYDCGTYQLAEVGTFTHKVVSYKSNIKSYMDIPPEYPWNFIDTAEAIADECIDLITRLGWPNLVIEHTEGSSHRISQRTLEFIHYALLRKLNEHGGYFMSANFQYLLNSDWRRACNCYISQWPEMQKWNKEVAKAKKKAKPNKAGAKVAKIDGKIVSKWNAKKLSMHIAKLYYPSFEDKITTDDISDAILLGYAAIKLKIFE